MAFVPEKVDEAFHEIAGHEYDGKIIVELKLFFPLILRSLTILVQWIQQGESQCQQIQNLDEMMSNDPENRPVYSGPEVSKEGVLGLRVEVEGLEGGLAAWWNLIHLGVAAALRAGLTGLQGLRGDEDDVGVSEDGVNDNNEGNNEKEEEGEGEIQNFPHQEKIVPLKVLPQNLERKGNIN